MLGVADENRCIGVPQHGVDEQRFLISVKTEEARTAELGDNWMLGLGVVCLVGAVLSFGSAAWLAWDSVRQVGPPREVLQGQSVW